MVNSYNVIFNKIVPKLFTIFKKLFLANLNPTRYFKKRCKSEREETPIPDVIFVTLTENLSIVTNDTQGPQKYPHHWK